MMYEGLEPQREPPQERPPYCAWTYDSKFSFCVSHSPGAGRLAWKYLFLMQRSSPSGKPPEHPLDGQALHKEHTGRKYDARLLGVPIEPPRARGTG
jgi:hypothetical protein